MKIIDTIAWILLVIGGLNWGLFAIAPFDAIAAIFGVGTGVAKIAYGLIGLSAIYAIFRCGKCCKCCKCKDNSCKM
jgi:uncharacterized membrane protein YuzA (DUF378 family)